MRGGVHHLLVLCHVGLGRSAREDGCARFRVQVCGEARGDAGFIDCGITARNLVT